MRLEPDTIVARAPGLDGSPGGGFRLSGPGAGSICGPLTPGVRRSPRLELEPRGGNSAIPIRTDFWTSTVVSSPPPELHGGRGREISLPRERWWGIVEERAGAWGPRPGGRRGSSPAGPTFMDRMEPPAGRGGWQNLVEGAQSRRSRTSRCTSSSGELLPSHRRLRGVLGGGGAYLVQHLDFPDERAPCPLSGRPGTGWRGGVAGPSGDGSRWCPPAGGGAGVLAGAPTCGEERFPRAHLGEGEGPSSRNEPGTTRTPWRSRFFLWGVSVSGLVARRA